MDDDTTQGADQQDPQGTKQEGKEASEQGGQAQQVLTAAKPEGNAAGQDEYQKAISERDQKIQELEAKVAEAAKSAEAAEKLRGEIADLKKASEDERLDFSLKLAGCRNVKAARAVLDDYKGDVDALKAGEPWLFAKVNATGASAGTTGLPSAGASGGSDEMRRWERLAGLTEKEG